MYRFLCDRQCLNATYVYLFNCHLNYTRDITAFSIRHKNKTKHGGTVRVRPHYSGAEVQGPLPLRDYPHCFSHMDSSINL